ncbi:cold shock small protein YmcF [Pantoea latae]|uniref:cold shock small protein YmcF n=1 Tax=Pantoea latae TaxID=1964541 RepID=UPI00117C3529|nr:cold-shock protein [Pantoea latae]
MTLSARRFRCPSCQSSQYRVSAFDQCKSNPYGAKCIFCKSAMVITGMLAR